MRKWQIFKENIEEIQTMFAEIRHGLEKSPLTADQAELLYARINRLEEEKHDLEDQLDDFRGADRLLDVITDFFKKNIKNDKPSLEAFALRLYEAWKDNPRVVAIRQMYESDIAEQQLRNYIKNEAACAELIQSLRLMVIPDKKANKYQGLIQAVKKAYNTVEDKSEFAIHDKSFMTVIYNNLNDEAKKSFLDKEGKVVIRRLQDALR